MREKSVDVYSLGKAFDMKKEIYLAGGCFWGTEKYMEQIRGVVYTEVGYANGRTEHPTYEDVCYQNTNHAETVKVVYDDKQVSLSFLLDLYYDAIDPISINRQGGDIGPQYRTGIYFKDVQDEPVIKNSMMNLQKKYQEKIAVEVKKLDHFYKAEEYHQKYLDKNPYGYCHIGREKFEKAKSAVDRQIRFKKSSKEDLKNRLTKMQYDVTQNNVTEAPFQNEYFDLFQRGIYVDVTTGEPLFISTDKFDSGCGWPSFSKPIDEAQIVRLTDVSHGMVRTEVRSQNGDAHLGHVFDEDRKSVV